jgi:hypothetical protein
LKLLDDLADARYRTCRRGQRILATWEGMSEGIRLEGASLLGKPLSDLLHAKTFTATEIELVQP